MNVCFSVLSKTTHEHKTYIVLWSATSMIKGMVNFRQLKFLGKIQKKMVQRNNPRISQTSPPVSSLMFWSHIQIRSSRQPLASHEAVALWVCWAEQRNAHTQLQMGSCFLMYPLYNTRGSCSFRMYRIALFSVLCSMHRWNGFNTTTVWEFTAITTPLVKQRSKAPTPSLRFCGN